MSPFHHPGRRSACTSICWFRPTAQLSNDAVERAIQFAKETGARVTALHVMPEYIPAFAEFPAAGQASFAES